MTDIRNEMRLFSVLCAAAIAASVVFYGCRTAERGAECRDPGCELAARAEAVRAWCVSRGFRDVKRTDAPTIGAVRLSYSDITTNGAFGISLWMETNRLSVAVGTGLSAKGREKEFDQFTMYANQGRRVWHWIRDDGSNVLVLWATMYDWLNVWDQPTNAVLQMVELGKSEYGRCLDALRAVQLGTKTPEDAWRTGPQSEMLLNFCGVAPGQDLSSLYQGLWDVLADKLPVKWDAKQRYPITFDIGLGPQVTHSSLSTNLTGFVRADRCYVECFLARPWGKGDKRVRLAPLVSKYNQDRGDGRWWVVEGGEPCIRMVYPTPYVISEPTRFVNACRSSVAEFLRHDEEMRQLLEGDLKLEDGR